MNYFPTGESREFSASRRFVGSQLTETGIIYFHRRMQELNLVDDRFADSAGIRIKNVIAHYVKRQIKFMLPHELVEQSESRRSAFLEQHMPKRLQAALCFLRYSSFHINSDASAH